MSSIQISDISGAVVEHTEVVINFIAEIKKQLKSSMCKVYGESTQYKWEVDGKEEVILPDASINCQVKARRGNSFINAPQFVMEVLSPSTEKYDRTEKKELYCKQEIPEYWIVDWRSRRVEIYTLDYDEKDEPQYYLYKVITDENKSELKIVHFPHIEIDFDELFEVG